MVSQTWDLAGADKSKPLSEMVDMAAHQKRMERRRRQAEDDRERSERRSAIFGLVVLAVSLSYLAYALMPEGFWTSLATLSIF